MPVLSHAHVWLYPYNLLLTIGHGRDKCPYTGLFLQDVEAGLEERCCTLIPWCQHHQL